MPDIVRLWMRINYPPHADTVETIKGLLANTGSIVKHVEEYLVCSGLARCEVWVEASPAVVAAAMNAVTAQFYGVAALEIADQEAFEYGWVDS